MSFNLDLAYLEAMWSAQAGRCYHFGVPLATDAADADSPARVSIDRINNDEGYVKGNVVLTCQAANLGRNKHSISKFARFIEWAHEHVDRRHAAKSALRASVLQNARAVLVCCFRRDARRFTAIARKHGANACSSPVVTGELASFCLHFEAGRGADDFLSALRYAPAVTAIDATGACNG